ncbi:hypothetical protein EV361DRAFT_936342 [Lentinula raphanica]|nr:hypothetical protein EV361DRAFT_936342 [Lentinula raphanica]
MLDPSALPLNYANYSLHPELLTRFSDPAFVMQPFDGQVGAILKNDHLISSPNSTVLFAPPLGPRRVRLRRNLHFSHDDPLFYPQPFDEERPHLPLIRAPSIDPKHPFVAAWQSPSEEDFEEVGDMLHDACILNNDFYLRIKTLANTITETVTLNDNESDVYLEQGTSQIQRMLSILLAAASRENIRTRVAFLQRNILEIDARIRYRSQRWADASCRNEDPVRLDVIGAFTDDLSTLHTLYNLGIPVWYVRPVRNTPDARIDRAATHLIAEDSSQIIELPGGFRLDGTDAQPNHKVVWEGMSNESERYTAMNAYLHSLLYPSSSVFGSKQPQMTSSHRRVASTRASSLLTENHTSYHHCSRFNSRSRTKPYYQHNRKKPQNHEQGLGNNLFLDVNNPSMSSAVPAWIRALTLQSSYNEALRPSDMVESGYFLPPPRLMDGPKNVVTRAFYYRSWLKIRPLMLQTLTGLTMPVKLSAKRWHCLLDVVGGHPVDTGDSERTKNSVYRAEMRPLLRTLITKVDPRPYDIDMNNSVPQIEEFNSQPVDCRMQPPPAHIASQILWEISEISFRQELVALDRQLDDSGLSLRQRDTMLDACWVGSRYQVDMTRPEEGLAAPDIQKRAPYIRALHRVMGSWRGDKPEDLCRALPDNVDTLGIGRIEESLAHFYITSYILVFGRAPSIPHILYS